MTVPGARPGPAPRFEAADLLLTQVLDDCLRAVDSSQLGDLTEDRAFELAVQLHGLLGVRLSMATAIRPASARWGR